MGWASGSRLMGDCIKAIQMRVPDGAMRRAIYHEMIGAFEDHDWDTQDECMGVDPCFDQAMHDRHPDWFADLREGDGDGATKDQSG